MSQIADLIANLKEITAVVNAFKSEAVQLRVVDALLAKIDVTREPPADAPATDTGAPKKKKNQSRVPSKPVEKSQSDKNRSGGHGAHSIILKFLDEGFFNAPKTIGDITKDASERLGHHIKANECSPSLLRLLRLGRLKRNKNGDSQYQYVQA